MVSEPIVYNTRTVYDKAGGGGGMVLIPPEDYLRLEYIGNVGDSYCEIYKYYEGFGIDILFSRNGDSAGSGNRSVIRHRGNLADSSIDFGNYSGISFQLNYYTFSFQNYISCNATNSDLIRINAHHVNNSAVVKLDYFYRQNEITASVSSTDITKSNQTFIWEPWQNAADRQYCNIYFCKIYDYSDKLVLNLVPVKRVLDSKLGFYDFVDKIFYPIEGSGAKQGLPFVWD